MPVILLLFNPPRKAKILKILLKFGNTSKLITQMEKLVNPPTPYPSGDSWGLLDTSISSAQFSQSTPTALKSETLVQTPEHKVISWKVNTVHHE